MGPLWECPCHSTAPIASLLSPCPRRCFSDHLQCFYFPFDLVPLSYSPLPCWDMTLLCTFSYLLKTARIFARWRIVIWMKRRKRQLALDNFSITTIFIKWVARTGIQKCSPSDRVEKCVSSCKRAAPWRVDRDKCHFREVQEKSCL